MIKFLLTIVVTLSSIALANTGTYSPIIDDAGFSYYLPSGSTANTTISYWTIGVQDDKLVVRISHEASPGALIHRFTAIDRLPSEIMERLYGSSPVNWTFEVRREREAELERLRDLAGMSPLNSGAFEPSAMPRHSGRATRNTTMEDAKSLGKLNPFYTLTGYDHNDAATTGRQLYRISRYLIDTLKANNDTIRMKYIAAVAPQVKRRSICR